MKTKKIVVVAFAALICLAGCSSSSSDSAPPFDPPVHLPEIGGGDTPVIPVPPIEDGGDWEQMLLEIEEYYGIPVEDSYDLCTTDNVACYWSNDTKTFQWLWYQLEGKREGDRIDVKFYLDPITVDQGYPPITAKLTNVNLTDPVDQEQYEKAQLTWYSCSAGSVDCNLPFRKVAFQLSSLVANGYETSDYVQVEEAMTVKDMYDTAHGDGTEFRIDQKYQQAGVTPSSILLELDDSDDRKESLLGATAWVLRHIYQ